MAEVHLIRQFTAATACLLCLQAAFAAPDHDDDHAGRLAAACTTCHTPDAPRAAAIPGLHGRPAEELLDRLAAFRDGRTPATLMHQIVRAYRDDELRLIARHLSKPPRTMP